MLSSPLDSQEHGPLCGHDNDQGPIHTHTHAHDPSLPHPAQAAPWSILRMTVVSRMGAAVAVSACLWAVVLLAMR
jgi:hypothetical protein